jgi:hypothetical protein
MPETPRFARPARPKHDILDGEFLVGSDHIDFVGFSLNRFVTFTTGRLVL